jgi:hypothetical protein
MSDNNSNDNNGDLSNWEFLTQYYDNGIMLDDDHFSIIDATVILPQRDNRLLTAALPICFKRERSEFKPNASAESGECDDDFHRQVQRRQLLTQRQASSPLYKSSHYQHCKSLEKSLVVINGSSDLSTVNPSWPIETNLPWPFETNDNSVCTNIENGQSIPSGKSSKVTSQVEALTDAHSPSHQQYLNPYWNVLTHVEEIESSIQSHNFLGYPRNAIPIPSNLLFHPKSEAMGEGISYHISNHDRTKLQANANLEQDSFQHFTGYGNDKIYTSQRHNCKIITEKCLINTNEIMRMLDKKDTSTLESKKVGIESGGSMLDACNATANHHYNSIDEATAPYQNDVPYDVNGIEISKAATTANLQHSTHWGSPVPPYLRLEDNSLLLKPLSPYNYFYRDERDSIVLQLSRDSDHLPPPTSDFSPEKMNHLLHQHWYIDPVKTKRVHRKTHGKISFQKLSETISDRWRSLPKHGREFYRSVTRQDEVYYNQHLANVMKQKGTINDEESAHEQPDDPVTATDVTLI